MVKEKNMNIRYKGASEDTRGKRLAEIQFKENEEENLRRFILITGQFESWKYSFEDEVLVIQVADKEEYDYIKDYYLNYKSFDIKNHIKKYKKLIEDYHGAFTTPAGVYDKVETDLDMYLILVNDGHDENFIKYVMDGVSGGPDAYNNALEMYNMKIG